MMKIAVPTSRPPVTAMGSTTEVEGGEDVALVDVRIGGCLAWLQDTAGGGTCSLPFVLGVLIQIDEFCLTRY